MLLTAWRLAVGVLFVLATIPKLADPTDLVNVLYWDGLRGLTLEMAVRFVIFGEVLVATLLLVMKSRVVLFGTCILLSILTLQLVALAVAPEAPHCACMKLFAEGSITARGEAVAGVVRNGAIILSGLVLLWKSRPRDLRLAAGTAAAGQYQRGRASSRTAFTLVELLVVLAIIAIGLATVLPAVSQVRRSARTVQCASNLHSIGHPLFVYASESKGIVPRDCVPNDPSSSFEFVAARTLVKSFDGTDVDALCSINFLRCPEMAPEVALPGCYVSNAFAFISNVDEPLMFTAIRSPLGRIRNPSSVIYVLNSSDYSGQPGGGDDENMLYDVLAHDVWASYLLQPNSSFCRIGYARHGRGTNALMFDGSVQFLSQDEVCDVHHYDDRLRGTAGRALFTMLVH